MTTLEALGHLGEFIGAMGVVISLVYLAHQMIQNTKSVRAASFNSMVQNSLRLLEHAFVDSEFAAFLERAERDPSKLTASDRVRWDAYMTAVFRHFGNLVYQHRVGAIDTQMWESYRRTLADDLRREAWVAWYREHAHLFSTALTEQVEEAIRERAAFRSSGRIERPKPEPVGV